VKASMTTTAALGSPSHVLVELASRVLTVEPCDQLDHGARSTWAARDGNGMCFTARVLARKRLCGRWPAWQHGAGVALDVAGDQVGRVA